MPAQLGRNRTDISQLDTAILTGGRNAVKIATADASRKVAGRGKVGGRKPMDALSAEERTELAQESRCGPRGEAGQSSQERSGEKESCKESPGRRNQRTRKMARVAMSSKKTAIKNKSKRSTMPTSVTSLFCTSRDVDKRCEELASGT
jgi:hypothetical protein